LKKTISSKTPLSSLIVAVNNGPKLSAAAASSIQNSSGPLDEAFPNLSKACNRQATVEIGKPLKGNNPYITRDSPFYLTIYDEGGEYSNGPTYYGKTCRGMNVELKALDDASRNHFHSYGDENEENDDFKKIFPTVHKWMLAPGKNWLQFGRCRGTFFQAFKGKNIVFSTNQFHYLHPSFQAFELFLKNK